MSELTKEKLDELELFADACSQRGFGQVDMDTLLSLIAAARELESGMLHMAALELESRAAVVARTEMVSCSRGSMAWINAAETLSDHVEELGRILSSREPTNGR